MGRRKKAAKKAVKKKRPTVGKVFKCILCNHDQSVTCKVHYDNKIGELNCSVCSASFKTTAHDLTEPIDVFTDWLDATNDEQMKVVSKYALKASRVNAEEQRDRLIEEERDANEDQDIGSLDDFDHADD